MNPSLTRRDFVASSTVTAAALASGCATTPRGEPTTAAPSSAPATAAAALTPAVLRPAPTKLKVGLIGCGGRGTGAMTDMLTASPDVQLHAMGDAFPDRLAGSRATLAKLENGLADRATLPDERCFTGFHAYQQVLASDIDIAILATPPGFRAQHFAAAIDAGKHVFFEKPVAVDPTGIRAVLAAAAKAKEKNLSVVTGTQRRHENCYLESRKRIEDGAIGPVHSAAVYWNQGGLWMNPRKPEWSDLEWQLRNWLYFPWLSGDHITEQHVHNLDIAHWYMGGPPKRVIAMGGRQVRTSPAYGSVFDHFACEFEYEGGRRVTSYCRQIDGCASRCEEHIHGADGFAVLQSGGAEIYGKNPWKFKGEQPNPYEQEHADLLASITGRGPYLNEGERIAHSTLMAIMGRMSAYSGKSLSWSDALNSPLCLLPASLELGPMPTPDVAVPGKTPLA